MAGGDLHTNFCAVADCGIQRERPPGSPEQFRMEDGAPEAAQAAAGGAAAGEMGVGPDRAELLAGEVHLADRGFTIRAHRAAERIDPLDHAAGRAHPNAPAAVDRNRRGSFSHFDAANEGAVILQMADGVAAMRMRDPDVAVAWVDSDSLGPGPAMIKRPDLRPVRGEHANERLGIVSDPGPASRVLSDGPGTVRRMFQAWGSTWGSGAAVSQREHTGRPQDIIGIDETPKPPRPIEARCG